MATGPSDHSFNLQLHVKDMASGLLGKIKREFGALGSAIHLVVNMFKNFNSVSIKALTGFITMNAIIGVTKLFKLLINLNEEMAVMGQRFGMSGREVKAFSASIFAASARAGIMVDQTAAMANTLINAGFKDRNKELANLSTTLFKFSAITGVSAETGADFAAELSKLGYSSDTLLQKLSGLRNSLELSQIEMEAVVKITKEATLAFYLFGGSLSQNQLNANVEGIAKLSAVMQNLGINTQTTGDFIGTLLNPVKWRESLLTQKLNINFDDILKFQTGGIGDVGTFLKQIKNQIPGAFGNLNDPTVMNSLLLSKIVTFEQLTMLKQIYNMKDKDFERASALADITKIQTELYKNMGDVLMPMQKEWIAFLTAIMPGLQTIVVFITDVLRVGTGIIKLFTPVGGLLGGIFGKESSHLVKTITGGVLVTGITAVTVAIVKMFTNTIAGAIGAKTAVENAGLAVKGFGITAQAVSKVVKGLGLIGLVGTIGGVFAKKRFEVRDLAGICLTVGMMLGFTPFGIALMSVGALTLLLDKISPQVRGFTRMGIDLQGILGKTEAEAEASTGITDNITKSGEEAATVKTEAAIRSAKLWENIARQMNNTASNTAATKAVLEQLTGVVDRSNRENKYDKVNQRSYNAANLARSY